MPGQTTGVSPLLQLLPLFFIFGIFYFLLIKPQKKQEQERQKMLADLHKNDEVVTNSGIHGTVINVKDKTVILRVDENVKLEIEKNCISIKKKQQGAV